MNFSTLKLNILTVLLSVIGLSACGGGGGGGGSNSPTTSVVAEFTISRVASGTIQFDASNSRVNGAQNGTPSISTYSWNFGDNSPTDTGEIVQHSYTGGGNYSATLTVTDSTGDTDTFTLPTTFSVSGAVNPASNTAVDIDVNDPSRQNRASLGSNFISNNISAEAQLIDNPVLLNGFVNQTPTGAPPSGPSNFATDTDPDDFYSVTLVAGQFVSLQVSDHNPLQVSQNDIDLYLYDSNGLLVASSFSTNAAESVAAPLDGQYFIRVNAFSGVSKYLLNIGNNSLVSGLRAYGHNTDIIAGEAIVKTKRSAINSQSSSLSSSPITQALKGLSHQQSHQRPALLTFDSQDIVSPNSSSKLGSFLHQNNHSILNTIKTIKTLNQRADVEYAEPNYRVRTLREPNDTNYSFQWHYPQINLPQAWDITTGTPVSGDVIVAVVDSGILLNHSDLAGQLTADGYDFIRNDETANDNEPGIDSNPDDPGDGEGLLDSSWHGTHVAGTIAAASDNNRGVAGVAWGAKIMPIRALGKGGGSSYDVAQGIRYAAGLSNDSGLLPTQPASIINLSLGGGGFSSSTQALFNELYSAGIIVIASAGNESTSTPSYPASYDNVISVSATDLANNLAPYSNFGNAIDIAAPGGDASRDLNGDGYNDGVLSTLFDEENNREIYAFYEGTSMAAPHVAGVAALMKAIHPNLTADEFTASMQNGELSNDIGPSGRDNSFGYGLIDALKATQQAQLLSGGTAAGSMTSSTNNINFGTINSSFTLTLTAAGQTPPSVISVANSASWLTIGSSNINPDGSGDYVLTADRSVIPNAAIYTDTIFVELDNGNTLQIPVSIRVSSNIINTADSGYLFLLLLDADSFEFVQQVDVDLVNGTYEYSFENIPFGEYVLIGGSDIDNDFIICDAGESCGNYPTNEQPLRIIVDEDLTGLNFLATMTSDIINTAANSTKINKGYQRMPTKIIENSNNKTISAEK